MKFLNKTLAVLAILVLTTAQSCKKEFLETSPTTAVSSDIAFKTIEGAQGAIQGVHRMLYLYDAQGTYGLASLNVNMDMLGEDLVMHGAGNGWYNAAYRWTEFRNVTSGDLQYYYFYLYRIIRNANEIIDGITQTTADFQAVKAEAYYYRAFCHYMLVQLWGKRFDTTPGAPNSDLGIALALKNDFAKKPRNTVAEVYASINADLGNAAAGLTTYNRKFKDEININVVKALQARVALTTGKWADAITFANAAMVGFPLMSQAEYQAGFNNVNNPEWIWGSTTIEEQIDNYFGTFFAYMSLDLSSTNVRTNPKKINADLYNAFPATDVRLKNFASTATEYAPLVLPTFTTAKYMNKKFRAAGPNFGAGGLVYMRSSEMYLIKAEAQARSSDEAGARATLFSLVSARDASYTMSVKTGAALINEILLNRRLELWGEGRRFLDLKRLDSSLDRTTSGGHTATLTGNVLNVPAGDKRWQFLIPRAEILATGADIMVQNEL
jgi:hypothetical protein